MAKIPFNIKYRPQIESGEYKVVTVEGRPVRIICWDKKSEKKYGYHIVCLIEFGPNHEESAYYTIDGMVRLDDKEPYLFLITPEPELSEFEQEVRACVTKNLTTHIKDGNGREMSSTVFIDDDTAKGMSAELLELARKELEPEVLERLEAAYKNQDEVVYENGKRDGKAEALKDLPRWIDDGIPKGSGAIDISGLCGFDFIRRNGKFLRISDVEKLPGFNE